MKTYVFEIPSFIESLAIDYDLGYITLDEAKREYNQAGYNFSGKKIPDKEFIELLETHNPHNEEYYKWAKMHHRTTP